MFKCDYHTHTHYSFDGSPSSTPDALCEAAILNGVTDLAITDHFESNWKIDCVSDPYDAERAYISVMETKEKFKGKINLTYGIELGQSNQYPDEAKKLIDSQKFEFIIGSVHNLRGAPDFYYFDFTKINSDEYIFKLFERNISELQETVDIMDKIDTIAHITYIHRYLALAGKTYDFSKHFPSLEKLFMQMIRKDIALEVNVSTLWKGLGFAMPDLDILSLYRDCGGRFITVGTDSHSPEHIGDNVDEGFKIIKKAGLSDIIVIRNGNKTIVKI